MQARACIRGADMLTTQRWGLALIAAGLAACGGSDEPSMENLSGIWRATRLEFVNAANSSQRVELIAQGATLELNLNDNGAYRATLVMPGEPGEVTDGTWSYTSDTFTLQGAGASFSLVFDLDLQDDRLTLAGADAEYDFDDDGTDEPATLTMELVRD